MATADAERFYLIPAERAVAESGNTGLVASTPKTMRQKFAARFWPACPFYPRTHIPWVPGEQLPN